MNPNREKTISIVQSHGCSTSNLIAILQDIQAACSYLSEESLTVVAEMLDVSPSRASTVWRRSTRTSRSSRRAATSSRSAPVRHVTSASPGPIYDAIHRVPGPYTASARPRTTACSRLETVACLGACGLGPRHDGGRRGLSPDEPRGSPEAAGGDPRRRRRRRMSTLTREMFHAYQAQAQSRTSEASAQRGLRPDLRRHRLHRRRRHANL